MRGEVIHLDVKMNAEVASNDKYMGHRSCKGRKEIFTVFKKQKNVKGGAVNAEKRYFEEDRWREMEDDLKEEKWVTMQTIDS